jgi:glycosyltransferase involved in cell wall biosynthesis
MPRDAIPKVSVALCTYNGEDFIEEQLRSILGQTRMVDEIVIADDGSSDATQEIIAKWGKGRVEVLPAHESPLGIAANFSRALLATTGDVVFLSDQDDVWHPGKVATMVDRLWGSDQWLVHSDARLVDADGMPLGQTALDGLSATRAERHALASGRPFEVLVRRNLITGATLAVTRRAIDAALPVPEGWIHDEWLAIVSAALGTTAYINEPLMDYRQHHRNEIGITRASLKTRVDRVRAPRGRRTENLAHRAARLEEKLAMWGADPQLLDTVRAKRDFESARSQLPARRLSRVPGILRLAVRRGYPRFASQGWMDVTRDLLQADG